MNKAIDRVMERVRPMVDSHYVLVMVPTSRWIGSFWNRYPCDFARTYSMGIVTSTAPRRELFGLTFDLLAVVGTEHPQMNWGSVDVAREILERSRKPIYWNFPLRY